MFSERFTITKCILVIVNNTYQVRTEQNVSGRKGNRSGYGSGSKLLRFRVSRLRPKWTVLSWWRIMQPTRAKYSNLRGEERNELGMHGASTANYQREAVVERPTGRYGERALPARRDITSSRTEDVGDAPSRNAGWELGGRPFRGGPGFR